MPPRKPRIAAPRLAVALLLLALAVLAGAGAAGWRGPDRAQALPLQPGWNLIAAPGSAVSTGPAYTLQQNDTDYEKVNPGTPLVPGLGYWVPAPRLSAVPLGAGQSRATILAPAGQWVMVGDPSGIYPAVVSGADVLLGFDPVNGYVQLDPTLLAPGLGAFAMSLEGGRIQLDALNGGSTQTCNTEDVGSACPVSGACPQGYPAAVTDDALAHRAPLPGEPPLTGTIVLCFNDIVQALAAGYQQAPNPRVYAAGPATAVTSDMSVTVLGATLETPAAFMTRVQASGDLLCTGCDLGGATAVVSVEYAFENVNRPTTLVSTGYFVSEHQPTESSPSYFLIGSEFPVDPVHNGSPVAGTVSAVFTHAAFADIDMVDWRLDNPLIDVINTIPQPHGPNISFALNFRGPLAGHVVSYGGGSAPLKPYVPNAPIPLGPAAPAAAPGAAVTVPPPPALVPVSTPAPALPLTPGSAAPPSGGTTTTTTTGPAGTTTTTVPVPAVQPNAPYTR